ncbi:hypothetical protein CBR_g42093 [Chara braunii]|uniref:Retrotransposon gag domain-containing protein n=1 Tax=Chara braunii TaxID=69332 RepID=A0A388LWV8_CHABU|nr:hypothetical protein CBR_g42093 [Chara braunii]|eukprot:GBG86810.1 hypothetical protein CBR_g42093 [Chara braunii]
MGMDPSWDRGRIEMGSGRDRVRVGVGSGWDRVGFEVGVNQGQDEIESGLGWGWYWYGVRREIWLESGRDQVGFDSGLGWNWCGIEVGSRWNRVGIEVKLRWDQGRTGLASVWGRGGVEVGANQDRGEIESGLGWEWYQCGVRYEIGLESGRDRVGFEIGLGWKRCGIEVGSGWNRVGVKVGSIWGQGEIVLGSGWGRDGIEVGSRWERIGVTVRSTSGWGGDGTGMGFEARSGWSQGGIGVETLIGLVLSILAFFFAILFYVKEVSPGQQEDIHSLDDALTQFHSRLRQLEQRPVAAPDAIFSNTSDRLEALETDVGSLKDGVQLQQTATQQLEQRICTAANHSSSESRETAPKFDGQEIFCDSAKTDPIPWFRKFELTLQLHYVKEHKHHVYLYSRSRGACQAWLDNLLSKYGVVAADLHTKISWDDLKAAWHKRFQVEPPEIKAMDKLMVFEQGTLPSVDWIAEYQRLTSVPDIQMGFKAIRHYFISRSCLTLSNALTHVEDTLTTTAELFDKAAQIIITNKEAKNLRLSAAGPSRDQHRPKVAVVVAATLFDQTSEAMSANEGDRLAAAREGGRSSKGRGRGKTKTNTASSPGPALCANFHTYLSFYAPPTSPTDDEVAVGDILAYVTKVAREFRNQRYDDNNTPLLYVRIQVGQVSCNALLDSGASRKFMSQAFTQRAGLGAQVQRKANPTAINLADGRTQQLIDRYIEALPVYFAPHICEPVTFDILDTDFDIILGMPWLASADHTVNFHRRTLTVRDAFGAEVACTIPLPHPSIRCQVVTAKSFRATCAYEQPDEIDLCFLRTVAVADSSPTDLSSDPRVVRLLDKFADIFESPTGVVPDRPISHEIILEAGVVPPKGCIYRMSEEELTVLRA